MSKDQSDEPIELEERTTDNDPIDLGYSAVAKKTNEAKNESSSTPPRKGSSTASPNSSHKEGSNQQ